MELEDTCNKVWSETNKIERLCTSSELVSNDLYKDKDKVVELVFDKYFRISTLAGINTPSVGEIVEIIEETTPWNPPIKYKGIINQGITRTRIRRINKFISTQYRGQGNTIIPLIYKGELNVL